MPNQDMIDNIRNTHTRRIDHLAVVEQRARAEIRRARIFITVLATTCIALLVSTIVLAIAQG